MQRLYSAWQTSGANSTRVQFVGHARRLPSKFDAQQLCIGSGCLELRPATQGEPPAIESDRCRDTPLRGIDGTHVRLNRGARCTT